MELRSSRHVQSDTRLVGQAKCRGNYGVKERVESSLWTHVAQKWQPPSSSTLARSPGPRGAGIAGIAGAEWRASWGTRTVPSDRIMLEAPWAAQQPNKLPSSYGWASRHLEVRTADSAACSRNASAMCVVIGGDLATERTGQEPYYLNTVTLDSHLNAPHW